MKYFDADAVQARLEYPKLMDALSKGLAKGGVIAPLRTAHTIRTSSAGGDDTLLMMPAWENGAGIGVKLVTVMLAEPQDSGSTTNAIYILFDTATGRPTACLDGDSLTKRRTAAMSALAARYLARRDARTLLMIGTGELSQEMVAAHASARTLDRIILWGRNRQNALHRKAQLGTIGLDVELSEDLERAVKEADIICSATTAHEPIVRGSWLQSGQHLDLVGGFKPDMREVDDEAVAMSATFVDTRGAEKEAGDIVQPSRAGVLAPNHVRADLSELCAGSHGGRSSDVEITLFKSVGTAIADLIAARLVIESEEGK